MRAGDMDRRVVIQSRTDAIDGLGQPVPTWTTLATVWAALEPGRGREFFAASGIVAETPMMFRIRWRTDVTTTCRIQYAGATYTIDAVEDFADLHVETRIYARAGVNEG
jgi:SPP1 family predicted phage head-tail adaptor